MKIPGRGRNMNEITWYKPISVLCVFLCAFLLSACTDRTERTSATLPVGIPSPTTSPSPTRLPVVHLTGSVVLTATINAFERELEQPSAYLDLDTGRVSNTIASDVQFVLSAGSDLAYLLAPRNGARAVEAGINEPGFEGCTAMVGPLAIDASWATPEHYICVITNRDHIAQIKIDSLKVVSYYDLVIQVSFITWEEIVEASQ